MSAGFNIRVEITQQGYDDDDMIGGAVYTGTVIQTLPCRLTPMSRSMMSLEQGIEGINIFFLDLPRRARITENDYVKVVYPPTHQYYQQRFTVTGVQNTSMHPRDSRGYTRATVRRVERGRSRI